MRLAFRPQYTIHRVMSATVTNNPACINLDWRSTPEWTTVLSRRLWGQTNWTALVTNAAWHFKDTNVTVNQKYEYDLTHVQTADYKRYLASGIYLAPLDNRGKIILLVDNTLTNALTNELNQLH